MTEACTYCNTLHKAIANENYCSKAMDSMSSVSSNAYYFKENNLESGEHISRLSFRVISEGYQNHQVGKKHVSLDNSEYLVLNEGQEFLSEIKTNKPIEGLVIAFNQNDFQSMMSLNHKTDHFLLDNPFMHYDHSPAFEIKKLPIQSNFKAQIELLKVQMQGDNQDQLLYEEIFAKLLFQFTKDLQLVTENTNRLEVIKRKTKIEIYKRVEQAKMFLENNLDKNISLKDLGKIATMSHYHLLRNFKAIHERTPYQYLATKRLQKAQFLLQDSDQPALEIGQTVGFSNKSAFGRFFKTMTGLTPKSYRKQFIN